VWGLGTSRVWELGSKVGGSGVRVEGKGFRVWGLDLSGVEGFRV